jgi:hypothetical protein
MAFPYNFFFHNLEKLNHNISLLYYVNEELRTIMKFVVILEKKKKKIKKKKIFPSKT